jgi:hypothetical protein
MFNELKLYIMEKSTYLDRLMKRMTPEKLEKMKQERIEQKNKLTLDWQLGYYVGENIVHNDLPTISAEPGTRTIIPVSLEDEQEYKRKEETWWDSTNFGRKKADKEWNEYQECRKRLLKKYLPNPLKCYERILNISNMDEFKNGFICSLWNSDVCNYNLNPEKIKIYDDEDIYFTVIELELSDED